MTSTVARHHTEWLSLVEISGPFLTLPVLERALPQGLEPIESDLADRVRLAYEEWRADPKLHRVWIRWVLTEVLGFDEESLKEGPAIPSSLSYTAAEHGETLRPELAVLDPASQSPKPRMLIIMWPEEVTLGDRLPDRRWVASPLDRMTDLLRATGVRLGLVTNGERWTLVHAPARRATTYASWEASLWIEERITLAAFRTFLGARRFFAVAEADTTEALFEESANAEQEVTDQLGKQVRQAVELLVDALSRADREHHGELFRQIREENLLIPGAQTREQLLYLAAVTVMMRLVFLICAEERRLFPLDDELYNQSYAASTLHAQLQDEADRFGEEPLERRSSAWYRLLAVFRMVHGGVQHEDLRIPPYGGSLFDPDRFPFLEGRRFNEPWWDNSGRPLPVDDRTVLHVLDALQVLRFRGRGAVTEARRLSFRALDVEQIGHVYEGLLDHAAVYVTEPAIGLDGPLGPEIALKELEERARVGRPAFIVWLAELTGRTPTAVEKALAAQLPREQWATLLAVCDNNTDLTKRVAPFHALLRKDLRGLPQVYVAGSVYVTKATERRSSGTYYTPRSLAEEMVRYALEPLVYQPGLAEGADPKDWKLKPPAEILKLKVCDMAMGSGAFLVAACRYLADRLVESWALTGQSTMTVEGAPASEESVLVVPNDLEDQEILARRLVADRCLYGVDKNPMAVEMAKLSIWLVTLAKDKPFSFLDHAFKCGDSLLGVQNLAQIAHFHMDPARGQEIHTTLDQHWRVWQSTVMQATEGRRKLESFTILTIRDAELKERLFREAEEALNVLKIAADMIVGVALSTACKRPDAFDRRLLAAAPDVAAALDLQRKSQDHRARLDSLRADAVYLLNEAKPSIHPERRAFHWPLEFPEVLQHGGFHAIIGNPPFQGAKKIRGALGSNYREYLVRHIACGRKGNADLVAYFFLRGTRLVRRAGVLALFATNTISQGDTREVGLDQICAHAWVIWRAWKSRPWPGESSLEVAEVFLSHGPWNGNFQLDERPVPGITASLSPLRHVTGRSHRLLHLSDKCFVGSLLNGIGFVLSQEEAGSLLEKNEKYRDVLFPYLSGEDLTSSPTQMPSRWVINFFDWPLGRAEDYPDCLAIVRERVKPHRDALGSYKQRVRDHWWQYEHPAKSLYERSKGLSRILTVARVSKHIAPVFVKPGIVLAEKVIAFLYEDDGSFGLIASSFHWWWALDQGVTLETRPVYDPKACFETFPQPRISPEIVKIGRRLHEFRQSVMVERNEGLTKTYNRVHDSSDHSTDIQEIRQLHVELDQAVAEAYGWSDLGLDHSFHETTQGLRFTIRPIARVEILDRLLELNHEHYRQEVAGGLHAKKTRPRHLQESTDGLTLEGMP